MKRSPWLPAASDGLIFGALILASLFLGALGNCLRSTPLSRLYAEPTSLTEPSDFDLPRFQALAGSGDGLILDARPGIFYELGHVPGALSLPREDFGAAYHSLRPRLEARRTGAIAVYCADDSCEDARGVQNALRRLGFDRVMVFPGGWAKWSAAGLPRERKMP